MYRRLIENASDIPVDSIIPKTLVGSKAEGLSKFYQGDFNVVYFIRFIDELCTRRHIVISETKQPGYCFFRNARSWAAN